MGTCRRNSSGIYGYSEFTGPFMQWRRLRGLYALCWTGTDRPSALFDRATAWLVTHKVLLPGASVLERSIARAYRQTVGYGACWRRGCEAKQSSGWAWGSRVKLARAPRREAHDDLNCFASLGRKHTILTQLGAARRELSFRRVGPAGAQLAMTACLGSRHAAHARGRSQTVIPGARPLGCVGSRRSAKLLRSWSPTARAAR